MALSNSSTNSDKCDIALSFKVSEWSLRIVSKAANIYSLESSDPIILLISCRLAAMGSLTSCVVHELPTTWRVLADWTASSSVPNVWLQEYAQLLGSSMRLSWWFRSPVIRTGSRRGRSGADKCPPAYLALFRSCSSRWTLGLPWRLQFSLFCCRLLSGWEAFGIAATCESLWAAPVVPWSPHTPYGHPKQLPYTFQWRNRQWSRG